MELTPEDGCDDIAVDRRADRPAQREGADHGPGGRRPRDALGHVRRCIADHLQPAGECGGPAPDSLPVFPLLQIVGEFVGRDDDADGGQDLEQTCRPRQPGSHGHSDATHSGDPAPGQGRFRRGDPLGTLSRLQVNGQLLLVPFEGRPGLAHEIPRAFLDGRPHAGGTGRDSDGLDLGDGLLRGIQDVETGIVVGHVLDDGVHDIAPGRGLGRVDQILGDRLRRRRHATRGATALHDALGRRGRVQIVDQIDDVTEGVGGTPEPTGRTAGILVRGVAGRIIAIQAVGVDVISRLGRRVFIEIDRPAREPDRVAAGEPSERRAEISILVVQQARLGVHALTGERVGIAQGGNPRAEDDGARAECDDPAGTRPEHRHIAIGVVLVRLDDPALAVRQGDRRAQRVLVVEEPLVARAGRGAAAAQVAVHDDGLVHGPEDVLLDEGAAAVAVLDVLPPVVIEVGGAVECAGVRHDLARAAVESVVRQL